MARVLYVTIPAEGHVNPTLGLVKQLVGNGEEVVYMCSEEYRDRLAQTGAQFRAYQLDEQVFRDLGFNPTEFKHPLHFTDFMLRGIIEPRIPEILRQIQNESFDYLIFDSLFGWGGAILGEKLGIPTICSVTNLAFAEPLSKIVEVFDASDAVDVDALYERVTQTAQSIARVCNVAVPAIEDITRQYGDMKIVFTSREFQPDADKLDDSYIFTGPSITSRPDAPSFPFEKLRSPHDKVVYISMGSILTKDVELYKLCFEAFQDIPAQFVLSCGKDTELESLGDNIPPNFIVEPYVPQLEVLQQADAFITHAGMNSTSEALYFHVPLVMIPLSSDQPIVAKRVEELGAGIMLDRGQLTPTALKDALLKVLNESTYKERAIQVGDSLRNAGGYQEAARRIMSLYSVLN
ncbi:macrolide family glycosyltransferase [Brevibacillus brevis]|uniref:macrolide family glycosyltransferase n=1 Tax=Brevibacillus brevis TaxID=1393 RepID=UPI000D109CA0|nr:macrolide family glycosyltransferase [Brevibacillus brevis]PSJ71266.1 glycosyl transferase [Brevibacillus brevis]RED28869.1 MGT family glycosyltransferase [Brevibacillus brevis]GEC90320.1 glycosyl transferase [Brevibacillus brevis]VEF91536.1 Oleandomycin glycosyltransferase [Brevibacillus brevis]